MNLGRHDMPVKKSVHPYLIELGSEIKKLRLQRQLSLEIVGGEIGLDASNLQKIELGQNLTLNTLLKICISLKISPGKLFEKISWDLSEKDIDFLTTARIIKKKKSKKTAKKRV
jgi:transcriptional regulator with XRE-family HTH domain